MKTKIYSQPLDSYEKELEEFLNRGFYTPVKNQTESLKELEETAKNYLDIYKSKSITLRVKNEKLIKIKAKAKKVGIPYQRLINTLIGQYADNKISLTI